MTRRVIAATIVAGVLAAPAVADAHTPSMRAELGPGDSITWQGSCAMGAARVNGHCGHWSNRLPGYVWPRLHVSFNGLTFAKRRTRSVRVSATCGTRS